MIIDRTDIKYVAAMCLSAGIIFGAGRYSVPPKYISHEVVVTKVVTKEVPVIEIRPEPIPVLELAEIPDAGKPPVSRPVIAKVKPTPVPSEHIILEEVPDNPYTSPGF